MGKKKQRRQAKKAKERERQRVVHTPQRPKLEDLATSYGYLQHGDGDDGPCLLVLPRRLEGDNMEFDRDLCAAGHKTFIRPKFPEEPALPIPPKPSFAGHWAMKVTEVHPGMRMRRVVWLARSLSDVEVWEQSQVSS
jgi:hypothetical protein